MASSRIKGITIEIGGDSTGLQNALKDVDKSIRDTQSELRDVDRLLKLDPKNTELLTQKQRLLSQEIEDTKKKLDTLKTAEKQVQEQFEKGEVSQETYEALKREIVATEQAEKALGDQLKDTNEKLEDSGDTSEKTAEKSKKLEAALIAVGAAVVGMAKSAVDYNAQMESYEAAFASFLGSAQDAQQAIKNIKEDASSMPFGASELIEANQMLITTGESAEESRDAIKNLASAVAATGGGNAELSRMASNLAQIKNTGKATSMDIKQFANAGINIYGLLADYTGKTVEEVQQMEITYEDLNAAFKQATEEGGRYYGAMEAQAQTYNGQLSSLKSRIQETLGETFKSVSDTLKNEIFPAINKALDSIDFEKLGASIGTIVSAIGQILPTVIPLVATVINLIGNVISAIMPLVTAVGDVLTEIVNLINNVFAGKWRAAWQGIVNIVKSVVRGITDTMINIINGIIDALNKVISWFNGNSSTIAKIGQAAGGSGQKQNLPPVSRVGNNAHAYSASGSVLSSGSTIVGEAGAELLTMNGGVATVQPISNNVTNLGGLSVSVYGAAGQSVNEIADAVMDRIQRAVTSKGAVWA